LVKLKTYKIFSTLLLYPNEDLRKNIVFAIDLLKKEAILDNFYITKMALFVDFILKSDLLYLQEYYVSLFDRQKNFSLYLFEHVHGDSRDRGMAMVDLKNLYRILEVDIPLGGELPDYIPVFLEYLSLLSVDKASALLGEIINIISVLSVRLKAVDSMYYLIFCALESLSNIRSDSDLVKKALNCNDFDKSLHSIDKNWEDMKSF
jgi:nitrate reductase delta subunit